jgi:hypothetical protein
MHVRWKKFVLLNPSIIDWLLNWCWPSPAQWFLPPRSTGFMILFYSLTALGAFRLGLFAYSVRDRVRVFYDWRFSANQFVLATNPLRLTTSNCFWLNNCFHILYVTSPVTKECFCRLKLLLVVASAVILKSESRMIHDHILLSQIRDSPKLEGQVLLFISPRNRVAQLRVYPQALGSFASPPTTRRAMVEVFEPASTRDLILNFF